MACKDDDFEKFSRVGRSNVGRAKAHERRVAKLLTEWSGVSFRRRRAEGRDINTLAIESCSDVIPVQADFQFSVEAKCGRDFSLDALLASPRTAKFTEWWHQCNYDSKLLSATRGRPYLPLLAFKPRPNDDWIAFSAKAVLRGIIMPHKQLDVAASPFVKRVANKDGDLKFVGLWFPHLYLDVYGWIGPVAGDVSHTKNKKIVELELDQAILCRWRDFAANVDYESAFYSISSRLDKDTPED